MKQIELPQVVGAEPAEPVVAGMTKRQILQELITNPPTSSFNPLENPVFDIKEKMNSND